MGDKECPDHLWGKEEPVHCKIGRKGSTAITVIKKVPARPDS